jgi:hypothetical protein
MELRKIFLFALLTVPFACQSQAPEQDRQSPMAVASMRYKDAYVKITYSRPQKNGREIFGKLVPYGQLWRTGANEATEITVTKNVQINGSLLKAGTYTIFSIPNKDKWTIVINTEVGLWGSYNYNSKLDEMRFDIPVQQVTGESSELFTIKFDQRNELADLIMTWDHVKVSIPFKFIN